MEQVETRRRDTSWVHGELAAGLDAFPHRIHRKNTSSRYHLIDKETFQDVLEKDFTQHRDYWRGNFQAEELVPALASRMWQRWGVNGVGILVDYKVDHMYNVVVYEEGGVDLYDPMKEIVVEPVDHETEKGLLIL